MVDKTARTKTGQHPRKSILCSSKHAKRNQFTTIPWRGMWRGPSSNSDADHGINLNFNSCNKVWIRIPLNPCGGDARAPPVPLPRTLSWLFQWVQYQEPACPPTCLPAYHHTRRSSFTQGQPHPQETAPWMSHN